jgi:hypothetical protein
MSAFPENDWRGTDSDADLTTMVAAVADSAGVWVHGDHREDPVTVNSSFVLDGNETGLAGFGDEEASVVPHVLKSMVLVLIILLAIFSNLLVVISVFRYQRLRHINNYFLVSLAVADLLVACFAMTFNATVEITGQWNFGYRICDLWNSLDVHFSTVSTLHLCCISMDRYFAIVRPLKYTSYMTVKVASIMIGIAWTAPTLISFLPIFLGWYTTAEHQVWRETHPDECIFRVNKPYALLSSTLTFWAPVITMLFMYRRIYKEALRQKEAIRRSSVPSQQHMIVDSDSVRSRFQALQANGFKSRNGAGAANNVSTRLVVPPPPPRSASYINVGTTPLPVPTIVPPAVTVSKTLRKTSSEDDEASVPLRAGECETHFGSGAPVTSAVVVTSATDAPPASGAPPSDGAGDATGAAPTSSTPTFGNSLTPPIANPFRRLSMANSILSEGRLVSARRLSSVCRT